MDEPHILTSDERAEIQEATNYCILPQELHPVLTQVQDLDIALSLEAGCTSIKLGDLLQLKPGSIIELDDSLNDTLRIFVNDKPIAQGAAITINGKRAVRITSIINGISDA